MRLAILLSAALSVSSAFAAEPVADTLKKMSGCFRVTFAFVEDAKHDAFYKPVLERTDIKSLSPLTLSRFLIIDGEEQPHWTETWTEVDATKRVWRQKVIGPYGDFRYECDGTWEMNQWRCLAPRSAKPRRDQARTYTFLDRENTLQVNDQRWVHAQSNRKVNKDGSLDSIEAAWNLYEKADDKLCVVP